MAESNTEEMYWRDQHAKQPYAHKDYGYEHYELAYRTGIRAAQEHTGRQFEEIESDLALNYEKNKGDTALPWDQARPAVKAAWDKIGGVITPRDPDRGARYGL